MAHRQLNILIFIFCLGFSNSVLAQANIDTVSFHKNILMECVRDLSISSKSFANSEKISYFDVVKQGEGSLLDSSDIIYADKIGSCFCLISTKEGFYTISFNDNNKIYGLDNHTEILDVSKINNSSDFVIYIIKSISKQMMSERTIYIHFVVVDKNNNACEYFSSDLILYSESIESLNSEKIEIHYSRTVEFKNDDRGLIIILKDDFSHIMSKYLLDFNKQHLIGIK